MILGSGELGKEMALEAHRMGLEIAVVDRYDMAPAMHVAHRKYVVDMTNQRALLSIIRREWPDAVIAEVEAINTEALQEVESDGIRVVPNADAVRVCMNRLELRKLAAEELGLPTTNFGFAESPEEVKSICVDVGYPCIIKPEMSSSGHGHVLIRSPAEVEKGFKDSIAEARGKSKRVVVEEFLKLDTELTILTYRYSSGATVETKTLEPIEHKRPGYYYVESWHPSTVGDEVKEKAKEMAKRFVERMGGLGIYGVEIMVSGDRVLFNEAAPRPHDTGMVTMVSQDVSEFQIHVRCALGLPVPEPKLVSPAASHVILAESEGWAPKYVNVEKALSIPGVQVRLFGKPFMYEHRRMGVILATGISVEEARRKAREASAIIQVVH
ncbi:phosphoribosylglycinamide formyltransferase [Sulfodiicoccus acidiphilus]|uniref:Formate-dependent phosphoribosylglycinamide formyltransferase n=1 Tax=Sulfodiicoccus acidiphilus TaxID=1670455 RepID=A0A348B3N9_9CREN|nr:phosphoribosylglycinamide formyltransferase [Sulfodiicoccus acidiphilus]